LHFQLFQLPCSLNLGLFACNRRLALCLLQFQSVFVLGLFRVRLIAPGFHDLLQFRLIRLVEIQAHGFKA
ncbi:hypothetical protein C0063_17910, partial [Pseudoxanthomonas sp. KAs_5_3]